MRTARFLALLFAALFALQASAAASTAPCAAPFAPTPPTPGPPAPSYCPDGELSCVDRVIREMERRFQPLAGTCDHDAVFSLVYLRTTEEFRRAVAEPGFFTDTDYLIRQDVLFADYYFRAYDAWAAGDTRRVPEAWRVAFDASRHRAVSGLGNLLLGMNAHINRDLPFVLAELGLTFPDGTSRKPDHDRVNDFLRRIVEPAIAEVALRFDSTVDDLNLPGTTIDEELVFQLVVSWREAAWYNAVRLARARSGFERALVTASIEAAAATTAHLIRAQTAYLPPLTSSDARDAWCAGQQDAGQRAAAQQHGGGAALAASGAGVEAGVEVSAAFPNPFNPQTIFTVSNAVDGPVRVEVFDLLGRRVALLHEGPLGAGTHAFTFDAAHLPSGRYLLRVHGDHFTHQQILTLMK